MRRAAIRGLRQLRQLFSWRDRAKPTPPRRCRTSPAPAFDRTGTRASRPARTVQLQAEDACGLSTTFAGKAATSFLPRVWQNAPMILRTALIFALLGRVSTASAQTPLTPAERAIVQSVDEHNAEGLALLEHVVN